MQISGLSEGVLHTLSSYSRNVPSSPLTPLVLRFSQVSPEFWASPNSTGFPALLSGGKKAGEGDTTFFTLNQPTTHTKYTHSEPLLGETGMFYSKTI